jgi:hypothetical protein
MLGIGEICKKRSHERIGGTVDWQFWTRAGAKDADPD